VDGSVAALRSEIARVADRLRTIPHAQLSAPCPPYGSRADAGRRAAQILADAAAGVEAAAQASPPHWPELPALGDFAVGDQVAVTGRELVDALSALPSPEQWVWTRDGRRTAADLAADVRRELGRVRRVL
jgi:hypothetical protein